VKYFYWLLLVGVVNAIIIYSRENILDFLVETVILCIVSTTALWIYYNKFWNTYEKYRKK
tara:strand:- start:941 stop:1120 length:180 start_codon:yes stop_codon:yes gene_type:complete